MSSIESAAILRRWFEDLDAAADEVSTKVLTQRGVSLVEVCTPFNLAEVKGRELPPYNPQSDALFDAGLALLKNAVSACYRADVLGIEQTFASARDAFVAMTPYVPAGTIPDDLFLVPTPTPQPLPSNPGTQQPPATTSTRVVGPAAAIARKLGCTDFIRRTAEGIEKARKLGFIAEDGGRCQYGGGEIQILTFASAGQQSEFVEGLGGFVARGWPYAVGPRELITSTEFVGLDEPTPEILDTMKEITRKLGFRLEYIPI